MGSAESKTVFQEKLNRLGDPVPFEDEEYWRSLFNCTLSLDEMCELIAPEDVRKLRNDKKLNTSNLFKRIVHCLKHHISETSHGSTAMPSKEASTSILTCVRLLTRIMPFMLEDTQDEFTRTLFWRPGGYVPVVQQEFRQQNLSEIREVHAQAAGGESSATGKAPVDKDRDTLTIGVELLASLQRLLFLKGFCCSATGVTLGYDEALPRHKLDTRFIWKGGIGASRELPTSHTAQMLKNRVEVLRCILVCLSGSLYQTIDEYQYVAPVWLRVFTRGEFPYTANVFSSLMGTIFTHDPVGLGIPYGGVFSSGTDESQLVHVTLQLLAVLFDFSPSLFHSSRHQLLSSAQPAAGPVSSVQYSDTRGEPVSSPGAAGAASAAGSAHPTSPNGQSSGGAIGHSATQDSLGDDTEARHALREGSSSVRNVYRSMLSSIKKDAEFDFIFDGFVRLLETGPHARKSYLPRSQQTIPCSQELLLVLWHQVTCNPHFLRRMASRLNCNRLLAPILFLLLDASNARAARETGPSRVGVLHMCSFLLLVMSSEREFAVRLNEPFTEKFPLEIPVFQGCYADLLVLVIHRVVVDSTSSPTNDSLIDMLLTVMCNISAYVKSFCLESCVKLTALLQRFSRLSWLFTAPYHYHDVFFLLDMFNNLIQYQYEGNQRLVYSILRQKDFFTDLQSLQFPHTYLAKRQMGKAGAEQGGGGSFSASSTATPSIQNGASDSRSNAGGEADQKGDKSGTAGRAGGDDSGGTVARRGSGGVGQWMPSEDWFLDWKAKLPLQTISRLIQCLLPMVESECQEKGLIDQSEVLAFLQKITLVGLLPVPHPIIIRNYQPNAYTSLWFTSYMWGLLFSQSQSLMLYDWTKIRLIAINNRYTAASSAASSGASSATSSSSASSSNVPTASSPTPAT